MDLAHPCSLANATINGCPHLGKDIQPHSSLWMPVSFLRDTLSRCLLCLPAARSLLNCHGLRVLRCSIFHLGIAWTCDLSSLCSQDPFQLSPPLLSPPILLTASQEGLSVPGFSLPVCLVNQVPRRASLLALSTKASSTTLGYLTQPLTLGHKQRPFPVSASTLQKVGGAAEHCRAPQTGLHLPHPPAPASRSGIWLRQIPSCLPDSSCSEPFPSPGAPHRLAPSLPLTDDLTP